MPWRELYRTAGGVVYKLWIGFLPESGVMFFDAKRQNRTKDGPVWLFDASLRRERCFDASIRGRFVTKLAYLALRGSSESDLDAEIDEAVEYYRSNRIERELVSGAPSA